MSLGLPSTLEPPDWRPTMPVIVAVIIVILVLAFLGPIHLLSLLLGIALGWLIWGYAARV